MFIIKHIGIMDSYCIAQQVSDFLLLNEPLAQGATKEVVFEHIAKHMLHPRVRLAVMLRQLLDFCALLQTSLIVTENDVASVDKSNAELYLKVIGQIMTLYKADTSGMLFADDENTNANGSSTGGGGSSGGGGGGNIVIK